MESSAHPGLVVFYDVDCGLCARSVRWMVAHCPPESVLFLPVTSELAHSLAPHRRPDEMAAVTRGVAYYGGDASIECLLATTDYRPLGHVLGACRPLVRWAYRQIARHRDHISKLVWGDECRIP